MIEDPGSKIQDKVLNPEDKGLRRSGVADFLDGGRDDGGGVFGVAEFQVHAAAYILELEHGATPGGTSDGDVNWVGAKFGMAGEKSIVASEQDGGVAVMKSLNVEDGGRREIVEKNSTFDFGLDDGVVDVVGEIGVRDEHNRT
jgi:hypothetical protein